MPRVRLSPHLARLEAESIHILREAAAAFANPVFLYSIGKDSTVMLHLALKAFAPGKPPFPVLHVDTLWKFRDMIEFRDRTCAEHGLDLLIHVNQEAVDAGVNPFTSGSNVHTVLTKTEGLKQAIARWGFDALIGGARRDEEKSRAKERIFSHRTATHVWDPRNQRPELWTLYNTHIAKGETMRVFPMSNWTELDVWTYVLACGLPVVPLYFSKERPVVERDGQLIMVDDDRMPLKPGETPQMRRIRFRSLGDYPLTAAVESEAASVEDIVAELMTTRASERLGRIIDHDEPSSMEKKKREGYF